MSRKWTQEDEGFLIENYTNMSLEELGAKLDRTAKATKTHWDAMKRKYPSLKKVNKKNKWDKEQEGFILRSMGTMTNEELAKALGKTPAAIQTRIQDMKSRYPGMYDIKRPRGRAVRRPRKKSDRKMQLNSCPQCGSRRFNELEYAAGGAKYYCVSCMKEFTGKGEYIKPIK